MRIVIVTVSMLFMSVSAFGQQAMPYGAGAPSDARNGGNGGGYGGAPQRGTYDSGSVVGVPTNSQPDPTNCGTPDEPKPCAPTHHRARHHAAKRS